VRTELEFFVTVILRKSLLLVQNTEAGELDEGTLQRLDELGASLREIEFEGRLLEERIRSGLYNVMMKE